MKFLFSILFSFALAGCNFNPATGSYPSASDWSIATKLLEDVDEDLLGGKVSKSFEKLGSTIADTISPDEPDEPLPDGYWDDLTLVSLDHLCERATLA